MKLRTKYSCLDMLRFAKFANNNHNLKPIEALSEYCKKYPQIKDDNVSNLRIWIESVGLILDDRKYCECEVPRHNYPEMVWCDNCGREISV